MYRVDSSGGNNPRPLRVILASADAQKKILNSAIKLKSKLAFKDVFINKDLTPWERQQRNILVAEKKRKQAESEAAGQSVSWVIHKGKVVQGRVKKKTDAKAEGAESIVIN